MKNPVLSPVAPPAPTARLALLLLLLVVCGPPAPEVGAAAGPARAALPRSAFPGRDPGLAWDGRSRLHAVYVEEAGGVARVYYRRPGDPGSRPVAVSPPGAATSAGEEVPPVIEVLPGGMLLAAYTAPLADRFQHEIRVQRSADDGRTWSAPVALPVRGDAGTAHQLSATVAAGGALVLAWLDQRQGERGLRVLRSLDGTRFEADRTIDGKTCECCGTSLLAGSGGEVWLAYRDADAQDVRDIHLATSRDRGARFGSPRPVSRDGWKLPGCPDSGPRLARDRGGRLWAVWFTGATPGLYAAASADGGASFAPREALVRLGRDADNAAHAEIGTLADGRLAVLYEAVRGGKRTLEARLRPAGAGPWGKPLKVDADATFPRLVSLGRGAGRTALAYTRNRRQGGEIVVRDAAEVFPAADAAGSS